MNFQVPGYLMKIIKSYLSKRKLIYNTTDGEKSVDVTSGAAQGSILGHDLWNVSYDDILIIDMPQNSGIGTKSWPHSHGLELATHKRLPLEIDMQVDEVFILTKNCVNYLGIRLDSKLTFSHQINYATKKSREILFN